jgi:hypothetical protein
LFGRAEKIFGIGEPKQLKICFAASENFWNGEQKQLKIDCICSAAQRKFLELANKSNSNYLFLFGRAAKNFGIGEQK